MSKKDFRQSKAWKDFRTVITRAFGGKDFITNRKLLKGYQVHHLDLREENYTNLDEKRLMPLNRKTHDFIHWLYTYWRKDKNIIARIVTVLEKMDSCSSDEAITK